MTRYVFSTQFIGTNFAGSQKQANARTVQEELEKAFSIFFRQNIKITLASRIDSGVHAREMIGHFDLRSELSVRGLETTSEHEICRHFNGILPNDIAILRFQETNEGFHSRRDACLRTYKYRLRSYSQRFPLDGSQVTYIASPLNKNHLDDMAKFLVGEHDFTGLSKPADYKTRPICKVTEAYWEESSNHETKDNLFTFTVSADHFLYNMIRIIVGTQIAIQNGKLPADSLEKALKYQDRSYAGFTASPTGLCLEKIKYPFQLFS